MVVVVVVVVVMVVVDVTDMLLSGCLLSFTLCSHNAASKFNGRGGGWNWGRHVDQ